MRKLTVLQTSRDQVVNANSLFFQALANNIRTNIILYLLKNGPRNVSSISTDLGIEQTQVSHNLRCLASCGFVKASREGKSRIYSLNQETVPPLLKIVNRHLDKYASNLYNCERLER